MHPHGPRWGCSGLISQPLLQLTVAVLKHFGEKDTGRIWLGWVSLSSQINRFIHLHPAGWPHTNEGAGNRRTWLLDWDVTRAQDLLLETNPHNTKALFPEAEYSPGDPGL